jgi:serine/threonine protein kinase, bacterial
MSAEEPETEAGAANDVTEVVDDDFSTRLRNVAGRQETQEAWSDEDDAADDAESQSQPWSVVTGHAAALVSVGAAVAAVIAVVGWMMLHKDRPAASPAAEKNTPPAAALAPPPPSTMTVQATPPPPVLTTTSTADPAPAFHTALPACYQHHPVEEKPTTSSTACRMHWYENLSWTSWGPNAADGTGVEQLQNCTPVCASGQIWRNPVEVHFSDPEPPPPDSGCPSDMRFYTQLIVAYPTTPAPPEAAMPYNGPVYTQYNGMPAYRWNSLTPNCSWP